MFGQLFLRSSWSWLYLFLRVLGAEKRYLIFMSVELNRVHRFGWVWMPQYSSGAFGEKSLCKCFVFYSCS